MDESHDIETSDQIYGKTINFKLFNVHEVEVNSKRFEFLITTYNNLFIL